MLTGRIKVQKKKENLHLLQLARLGFSSAKKSEENVEESRMTGTTFFEEIFKENSCIIIKFVRLNWLAMKEAV